MDGEFVHYFLCEGGDEEEEFSSEKEKMLKVFENYSLGDFWSLSEKEKVL